MKEILTPAVVGLIAGIIGSFFTPWIRYFIERSKNRNQNRLEKIESWRNWLSGKSDNTNPKESILASVEYTTLRSHCEKEIIEKLETKNIVWLSPRGDYARAILLDEVSRIEKKWKLI